MQNSLIIINKREYYHEYENAFIYSDTVQRDVNIQANIAEVSQSIESLSGKSK